MHFLYFPSPSLYISIWIIFSVRISVNPSVITVVSIFVWISVLIISSVEEFSFNSFKKCFCLYSIFIDNVVIIIYNIVLYINRSPDYITVSYCKFTNKYWFFVCGTQNIETTRDRTTLLYNWWHQNVRRCTQLSNGICHVYYNYYQAYGQKDNGGATTRIIGGNGSEMLSQNNKFNVYTK